MEPPLKFAVFFIILIFVLAAVEICPAEKMPTDIAIEHSQQSPNRALGILEGSILIETKLISPNENNLPLANRSVLFEITIGGKFLRKTDSTFQLVDSSTNFVINTSDDGTIKMKIGLGNDAAGKPIDPRKISYSITATFTPVEKDRDRYYGSTRNVRYTPGVTPIFSLAACLPLFAVLALLMGAMYASGRDPFAFFDFTRGAFRLPAPKRKPPKPVQVAPPSLEKIASMVKKVGIVLSPKKMAELKKLGAERDKLRQQLRDAIKDKNKEKADALRNKIAQLDAAIGRIVKPVRIESWLAEQAMLAKGRVWSLPGLKQVSEAGKIVRGAAVLGLEKVAKPVIAPVAKGFVKVVKFTVAEGMKLPLRVAKLSLRVAGAPLTVAKGAVVLGALVTGKKELAKKIWKLPVTPLAIAKALAPKLPGWYDIAKDWLNIKFVKPILAIPIYMPRKSEVKSVSKLPPVPEAVPVPVKPELSAEEKKYLPTYNKLTKNERVSKLLEGAPSIEGVDTKKLVLANVGQLTKRYPLTKENKKLIWIKYSALLKSLPENERKEAMTVLYAMERTVAILKQLKGSTISLDQKLAAILIANARGLGHGMKYLEYMGKGKEEKGYIDGTIRKEAAKKQLKTTLDEFRGSFALPVVPKVPEKPEKVPFAEVKATKVTLGDVLSRALEIGRNSALFTIGRGEWALKAQEWFKENSIIIHIGASKEDAKKLIEEYYRRVGGAQYIGGGGRFLTINSATVLRYTSDVKEAVAEFKKEEKKREVIEEKYKIGGVNISEILDSKLVPEKLKVTFLNMLIEKNGKEIKDIEAKISMMVKDAGIPEKNKLNLLELGEKINKLEILPKRTDEQESELKLARAQFGSICERYKLPKDTEKAIEGMDGRLEKKAEMFYVKGREKEAEAIEKKIEGMRWEIENLGNTLATCKGQNEILKSSRDARNAIIGLTAASEANNNFLGNIFLRDVPVKDMEKEAKILDKVVTSLKKEEPIIANALSEISKGYKEAAEGLEDRKKLLSLKREIDTFEALPVKTYTDKVRLTSLRADFEPLCEKHKISKDIDFKALEAKTKSYEKDMAVVASAARERIITETSNKVIGVGAVYVDSAANAIKGSMTWSEKIKTLDEAAKESRKVGEENAAKVIEEASNSYKKASDGFEKIGSDQTALRDLRKDIDFLNSIPEGVRTPEQKERLKSFETYFGNLCKNYGISEGDARTAEGINKIMNVGRTEYWKKANDDITGMRFDEKAKLEGKEIDAKFGMLKNGIISGTWNLTTKVDETEVNLLANLQSQLEKVKETKGAEIAKGFVETFKGLQEESNKLKELEGIRETNIKIKEGKVPEGEIEDTKKWVSDKCKELGIDVTKIDEEIVKGRESLIKRTEDIGKELNEKKNDAFERQSKLNNYCIESAGAVALTDTWLKGSLITELTKENIVANVSYTDSSLLLSGLSMTKAPKDGEFGERSKEIKETEKAITDTISELRKKYGPVEEINRKIEDQNKSIRDIEKEIENLKARGAEEAARVKNSEKYEVVRKVEELQDAVKKIESLEKDQTTINGIGKGYSELQNSWNTLGDYKKIANYRDEANKERENYEKATKEGRPDEEIKEIKGKVESLEGKVESLQRKYELKDEDVKKIEKRIEWWEETIKTGKDEVFENEKKVGSFLLNPNELAVEKDEERLRALGKLGVSSDTTGCMMNELKTLDRPVEEYVSGKKVEAEAALEGAKDRRDAVSAVVERHLDGTGIDSGAITNFLTKPVSDMGAGEFTNLANIFIENKNYSAGVAVVEIKAQEYVAAEREGRKIDERERERYERTKRECYEEHQTLFISHMQKIGEEFGISISREEAEKYYKNTSNFTQSFTALPSKEQETVKEEMKGPGWIDRLSPADQSELMSYYGYVKDSAKYVEEFKNILLELERTRSKDTFEKLEEHWKRLDGYTDLMKRQADPVIKEEYDKYMKTMAKAREEMIGKETRLERIYESLRKKYEK